MRSRVGQKAVELSERRKAIVEGVKAGRSVTELAEELGISRSRAYELAREAIDRTPAPAVEALRAEENAKCDRDERALEAKIAKGSVRAVVARVRVGTHRAKVNGLYAPTPTLVGVGVNVTVDATAKPGPDLSRVSPCGLMATRAIFLVAEGRLPVAQAKRAIAEYAAELEAPAFDVRALPSAHASDASASGIDTIEEIRSQKQGQNEQTQGTNAPAATTRTT